MSVSRGDLGCWFDGGKATPQDSSHIHKNVRKLVVLMIEVEQPEGVSARKLVLETAKHNVITAYSGKSGLRLLHRFSNVDAVVVHSGTVDLPCGEIVREVKAAYPSLPVIVLSPRPDADSCDPADYVVDSMVPNDILKLLADKFGADVSAENE
jgi:response regulator RpfG family c-di-GMP phosphodiesterase